MLHKSYKLVTLSITAVTSRITPAKIEVVRKALRQFRFQGGFGCTKYPPIVECGSSPRTMIIVSIVHDTVSCSMGFLVGVGKWDGLVMCRNSCALVRCRCCILMQGCDVELL